MKADHEIVSHGGSGAAMSRLGRFMADARQLAGNPAAWPGFIRQHRLIEFATMIGLRGASAAGKFALSLYMLAYIGLAELGIYGLLVAAATGISGLLGFGLGDWATRQMMGASREDAVRIAATRLAFSLGIQCVAQPIFWLTNAWFGYPIPPEYAVLVALILLLEHLGNDTHAPLVARGRALLAAVCLFIRAGLWPFAIIMVGVFVPATRSLTWILVAWLVGLVVMMTVLSVAALGEGRWRLIRFDVPWLGSALRRCWPFWLSEIGAVGSLYGDRFIISLLLGLELTGIYVFFWSAANVLHSIAVYGTFHPRVPELVEAVKRNDAALFRQRLLNSQIATLVWAVVLAIALWIAVDIFVHVTDKVEMRDHFDIFAWVMFGTLLRIFADSYHFVLYALHRDRAIAAVNLGGAALSALLNLVLVSALGLAGAATALIVTGCGLLAVRLRLSRLVSRDSIGWTAVEVPRV